MNTGAATGVVRALLTVGHNVGHQEIAPNMSIVTDLGIDSMRLVELTVALEDSLGIEHFPSQQWVDDEMSKDGVRFTVGSLIRQCEICLQAQRALP
jgi:acyl carrier protein